MLSAVAFAVLLFPPPPPPEEAPPVYAPLCPAPLLTAEFGSGPTTVVAGSTPFTYTLRTSDTDTYSIFNDLGKTIQIASDAHHIAVNTYGVNSGTIAQGLRLEGANQSGTKTYSIVISPLSVANLNGEPWMIKVDYFIGIDGAQDAKLHDPSYEFTHTITITAPQ